ncbi:MAG: hypothetical protein LIR40_14705 [Bacteroidota bacterium]|nr:hypothetical protein [Bacteroidota bacterium]
MKDRVCLTTFVYGEKYQDYIPLLLYSCKKAYPEYDIVLFLYEPLRTDIKRILDEIGIDLSGVIIKENAYHHIGKMDSWICRTIRWTLWDESFNKYDYLYIIDIDMFYIKEPVAIHEQHKIHMEVLGLPFSNVKRHSYVKSRDKLNILRRLKHAGLINFIEFLNSHGKEQNRVTGLHFVDIKKYYTILDKSMRDSIEKMISNKNIYKYVNEPNDEVILGTILSTFMEFDMNQLAYQEVQSIVLDFNNFDKKEFRPHHGIHLGIFRTETERFNSDTLTILNSNAYAYYINYLRDNILKDEMYKHIYSLLPESPKILMNRLLHFYNLPH